MMSTQDSQTLLHYLEWFPQNNDGWTPKLAPQTAKAPRRRAATQWCATASAVLGVSPPAAASRAAARREKTSRVRGGTPPVPGKKPGGLGWVGMGSCLAVCQNLVPLVNIKIAGKWMFIPIKNGINRYWSIPVSVHAGRMCPGMMSVLVGGIIKNFCEWV